MLPYLSHVMATVSTTGQEVVMGVERSGIHRAHTLDATLAHDHGTLRLSCFASPSGHHPNPREGFWRVIQDASGAGRGCTALPLCSQRI